MGTFWAFYLIYFEYLLQNAMNTGLQVSILINNNQMGNLKDYLHFSYGNPQNRQASLTCQCLC